MVKLTDEAIAENIKAFIRHGLPIHSSFELTTRPLAQELRVEVRFNMLPSEINLAPLLLQIQPPENEAAFPKISREVMQVLAEKKTASVSGNFGDMRPVTICFSLN